MKKNNIIKKELQLKTNRDPYFDNLKLLLVFLVVLGHFFNVATFSSNAPVGRFIIYTFHMPLFIFVSGLFFNVENAENGVEKCCQYLSF